MTCSFSLAYLISLANDLEEVSMLKGGGRQEHSLDNEPFDGLFVEFFNRNYVH